jgi:hypothetical protein
MGASVYSGTFAISAGFRQPCGWLVELVKLSRMGPRSLHDAAIAIIVQAVLITAGGPVRAEAITAWFDPANIVVKNAGQDAEGVLLLYNRTNTPLRVLIVPGSIQLSGTVAEATLRVGPTEGNDYIDTTLPPGEERASPDRIPFHISGLSHLGTYQVGIQVFWTEALKPIHRPLPLRLRDRLPILQ